MVWIAFTGNCAGAAAGWDEDAGGAVRESDGFGPWRAHKSPAMKGIAAITQAKAKRHLQVTFAEFVAIVIFMDSRLLCRKGHALALIPADDFHCIDGRS